MRKATAVAFLALTLAGSAAWHEHLKPMPQVLAMVMASCALLLAWLQPRFFRPVWFLVFAWASFGALWEGAVVLKHALFPPQPLPPGAHVTGGELDRWYFLWSWPSTFCFIATPVALWALYRWGPRSRTLEIVFAVAALLTWAILFVLNET